MKSGQLQKFLIVAVVAISAAFTAAAGQELASSSLDYRLPVNVVPSHYDIKLIPYLENETFTFEGEVDVSVEVLEQTYSIILHSDQLEIVDEGVYSSNGTQINNTAIYNETLQFYTLLFENPLNPGDYLISFKYTGQPRQDDLKGFYRSYYNTSTGDVRTYAGSFFAPIYARRAFPCFDEPGFKATFNLSIAHWPNQIALSNTLNESVSATDSTIGDRVWSKFATTPLISTYLVAFMVFDFDHVSTNEESFRIWFRPEAGDSASYSLAGISLLDQLSNYTNISYFDSILPKMDQVALSINSPIAMENLGLITYREPWLLWQEGVSTTRDEQNIVTVGAHEFSHQWFGNLVTPEWWNYVWLSEGFSEYFSYYISDIVNPDWRLMEQFTIDVCNPALLADSLSATSHPLNRDVNTPDEVNSVFDVISYKKGACVLRMLSIIFDESVFQEALRNYLKDNSYGNANPVKLWDSLIAADAEISDGLARLVNISAMFDTWTNQKGYPVITLNRTYSGELSMIITQEIFLLKGRESADNDTAEYRWWIPFNIATRSVPDFYFKPNNWIRADESVNFGAGSASDWVILNGQQAGFYRVNYDDRNWNLIATHLQSNNFVDIPPGARGQLIDDAFNLARAGYLHYNVSLSLSRYLSQERDYIPWAAAFKAFSFLTKILANSTSHENLKTYLFSLVAPVHNNLGYTVQDTDEHVTNFLRADSHSLACQMGCPGCNAQAKNLVLNYYNSNGNTPIAVDLRTWAYCEGVREASIDVWNFMWGRYLSSNVAGEQALILSGLGCSGNGAILNRYLNFTITENSGLRSHHKTEVFHSVYHKTPANVDIALDFLIANFDAVTESYGGKNVALNLLNNIASHLVSESQIASLETFVFVQNNLEGVDSSAAQNALEIAQENIEWLEIYEDDITRWLYDETRSAGNSLTSTISSLTLVFIFTIVKSL